MTNGQLATSYPVLPAASTPQPQEATRPDTVRVLQPTTGLPLSLAEDRTRPGHVTPTPVPTSPRPPESKRGPKAQAPAPTRAPNTH